MDSGLAAQVVNAEHVVADASRGRLRRRLDMLSNGDRAVFLAIAVIVILMVIGPIVAPHPTEKADPLQRLLTPRAGHWFGTDANGMDVFSRVLASFRIDVAIALIATSISVIVGAVLGVLIAQLEGVGAGRRIAGIGAETALRILDVVQAFPVFIFAMVLVAIRGTNTTNIIAAIAFVNFPVFVRLVRSELLTLQTRPFTEAARAIGNPHLRIGFRHLLPNAIPAVIVQISVTVGFAILLTAGLSFVGAGVNPPTPELGAMIAGGARFLITGQWWPAVFPGVFLALTVFTFALFGEAVGRLISGDRRTEQPLDQPPDRVQTAESEGGEPDVGELVSLRTRPLAGAPLLRLEGISVTFGSDRRGGSASGLHDVSLVIAPRDRVGIVGETGSGKSLLVRAILDILPEHASATGDIEVDGRKLATLPPAELRRVRGTVMAPILPNAKVQLNPLVRVGKLMEVVLRAHDASLDRSALHERSRAALAQVGISDAERRLRQYPHELSGGMAQRVCIALALLHSPKLLVADEPTAGLDVTVQRQVLDLLRDLSDRRDAAQLIVTRDLSIVAQYCNWVGVMHRGRLVEFGPTLEVFDEPRHPHTRALLEASHGGAIADERCGR